MVLKFFIFFAYFVITDAITADDFKQLYLKTVKETGQWKPPIDNSEFGKTSKKCTDYGNYDFIIVGGGTAGSVVANRLSANGTYSVLLLEVGGDELEFNQYLGNYFYTGKTESNWGYLTEPQSNYCHISSPTHQCVYHRGKGLGGCSSINGLVYARGNKLDFDEWSRLGNEGWSFEEVLPYFIKSQNASSITNADKNYHGFEGPFHISQNTPFPHEELVFRAFNELGLKTLDSNGKQQISVSKPQLAIRNGRRSSANTAYLQPIKDERNNLKIVTRALVTNIEFDKFRAIKVHFLNNKECYSAKVNREVIVSAGVVNSPQLLLLSGVGPKEELNKFNIPLIKELPVGKNFEEHATVPFTFKIKTNLSVHYSSFNDLMEETAKGVGRITTGSTVSLSFKGFKEDDQTPNYEIFCNYADYVNKRDIDEDKPVNKNLELVFSILLFNATSRGDVTLNSADPIQFPKINPNCFSDPADRTSMYNAIKDLLNIIDTETMKKINGRFEEKSLVAPGCKQFDLNNKYDEEFWRCFILQRGTTGLHGSGTCRMGVNTEDSVIDPQLKIHGIDNVRVVDASSFPTLPTGHNMANVIMLAEKASDIIIENNKI